MAKQTDFQKLQKQLDKRRAEINLAQDAIKTITKAMQGLCEHPRTEEWRWEHDNGYGKQSWNSGKRCIDCRMLNLHPGKYETWIRPDQYQPANYGGC